MIIPKKHILEDQQKIKYEKKQDSTMNSQRINSVQKQNPYFKKCKKQFTSPTFNLTSKVIYSDKKTLQSQKFKQQYQIQFDHHVITNIKEKKMSYQQRQTYQLSKKIQITKQLSFHSKLTKQSPQKYIINSKKYQPYKKKFKLFCQVKKKRNSKKDKSNGTIQKDRPILTTIKSQSDLRKSINYDFKQKIIQRKIHLNDKFIKLKSNQNLLKFKHYSQKSNESIKSNQNMKPVYSKIILKNLKKNKSQIQKNQSILKINRIKFFQNNFTPEITIFNLENQEKINNVKQSQKNSNIFCESSQIKQKKNIFQEKINEKLSSIKQQKNQDTIARFLDLVTSENSQIYKPTDQNSLNLGIDSICKHNQYQKFKTDSINQIYEQNGSFTDNTLKRSIQSSFSQISKDKLKINIEKFKEPKNIKQITSLISQSEQSISVIKKIQYHIQIINSLSNFVYKSTQIQYLMQDWDELNFLIYKKFYIQRMKILNFLKKYPIKNPFCIKKFTIQTKQILKALKQNASQIKNICDSLQKQNISIKKNLQIFYHNFNYSKQGQKINLFEYDNFSNFIYKQIWDQIQLFSYSRSHNQKQLQDIICKSLQAGFLIAELNGNYVTPFEDAQIATNQQKQKTYIDDNLKIFLRYILNKKR